MINLIKKKGSNPQTKEAIYYPQWTRVATTTKPTSDGEKDAAEDVQP